MSVTTTEELALRKIKQAEIVEPEGEYDGDQVEDLMQEDMVEALEILSQSMHLLDYLSDKDFCPTVPKRERANLAHMAEKIRTFLDEKEGYYEDDSDEESE